MMTGMTSGKRRTASRNEYFGHRRALLHDAHRPPEIAVHHQPDADQYARNHTREEQAADRYVARGAVDDRHDAGRNQVGHRRRGSNECGGERPVIAFLVHIARDGAAQHRHVGGRRTGDAGEEHAEQRHHLGQSAAQMTDEGLRQADHAMRNVGRRHQLPDEKEKRDGKQRLGINTVKELTDHRLHADLRKTRRDQHPGN